MPLELIEDKSMFDHYVSNTMSKTNSPKKIKKPGLVELIEDVFHKQHVGFNIGGGFLELAGPKGPNLSPMKMAGESKDIMGRDIYKDDIPGFSMKYTIGL